MRRPPFVGVERPAARREAEEQHEVRGEIRKTAERAPAEERATRLLRLPGLVTDEEIGLGEVVKRLTSAFGIKPCARCERRAQVLNRWMAFTGRKR